MKENKKSAIPELVRAAQTAGFDEQSAEFFRQVVAHTQLREHERAKLVEPRKLTDAPKIGTV